MLIEFSCFYSFIHVVCEKWNPERHVSQFLDILIRESLRYLIFLTYQLIFDRSEFFHFKFFEVIDDVVKTALFYEVSHPVFSQCDQRLLIINTVEWLTKVHVPHFPVLCSLLSA